MRGVQEKPEVRRLGKQKRRPCGVGGTCIPRFTCGREWYIFFAMAFNPRNLDWWCERVILALVVAALTALYSARRVVRSVELLRDGSHAIATGKLVKITRIVGTQYFVEVTN